MLSTVGNTAVKKRELNLYAFHCENDAIFKLKVYFLQAKEKNPVLHYSGGQKSELSPYFILWKTHF